MARWRSLEEYTPIARLLVDYMWEQRPPLLPSQFAAQMGLPKQLVSSWLNGQVTPTPAALLHLARRTHQPVSRLLVAAGYTQEADPLLDIPEAWTYVVTALHRLQEQRSAAAGEEEMLHFQQLAVLLQVAQADDLARWRTKAASPEEAGSDGTFWSRRRRRSEPLEPLEAAAGDVETDETNESDELEGELESELE